MKTFPSIPRVDEAPPELFRSGHLWLLEKVDGANVRFRLEESGRIVFGNRNRVYETAAAVPDPYGHAVRHLRERLDRDALRRAVDDVEQYVFFGEAMHHHTISYDWERTPSFLGFDVWSAADETFLGPDAADGIFDRLGLQAVPVIERERRARDFDPDSYEVPTSAYYDGPAEGVVLRNKRGGRAKLLHPDFREVDDTVPVGASAEELARRYATTHRFEKLTAKIEDQGRAVTFERLYDRVLEDIVREEHKRLHHGDSSVDMSAFRSEVGKLTRQFLDAERDGETRATRDD